MCWEWAVAIRLQRLAPAGVPFKNTAFKIIFVTPLVYYPVFFFCLFSFLGQVTTMGNVPDPAAFIWFAAIFPLPMFNTFCMFSCYFYTAKTFETIELQRAVSFSDFVLEFVLIWILTAQNQQYGIAGGEVSGYNMNNIFGDHPHIRTFSSHHQLHLQHNRFRTKPRPAKIGFIPIEDA